ncbi:MAG: trypsin-like peptidase domain-containing protein [Thermoanaerobaculales bacterium]|jgi:hypothetical protein|nr:trypsin-like peptidase domain-containing protein [Thermoanaerobaculales bacterium]
MKSTISLVTAFVVVTAAFVAVDASAASHRGLPPSLVQRVKSVDELEVARMPTVDVQAHLAEDEQRARTGEPAPRRFAADIPTSITPADAGTWETLPGGTALWRLRLTSPGALNLNLGFDRFELPAGAALWLSDPDGTVHQGPYVDGDRNAVGGLWTAAIPGDEIIVELRIAAQDAHRARLRISSVNHGYRHLGRSSDEAETKQGTCNIDVVCPESAGWEDQIRAVAHITISGIYLCTGQLMNTTAEDGRPYFLTAQHCIEDASEAPTIVAYWNFESPTCGQLSGGSLLQNQSGSTLVSSWEWKTGSDFTLVELDQTPDASFDVHYAGWDVSGTIPSGSVAIHHPNGDEKAISFNDDPLTKVNYYGYGSHQWRVDQWELGTTEGGSSGSCLFDPDSGLCVGTLTAGSASCTNLSGFDVFGRMDVHWNGNGTSDSRLSDWLDPLGTGATSLAGRDPGGSTGSSTWLVPAAASAPGIGTSNWKTQVVVANTSDEARQVRFFFVESGEPWPGTLLSGPHAVPAGGSFFADDPLASLNPASGILYVVADGPGTPVTTRTFNLAADGGTFGQGIPAIALDDAGFVSSYTLPMFMTDPSRFRANLGLVQTSTGSMAVRITIHQPDGSPLAVKTYSLSSGHRQINNLATSMGVTNHVVEGGWVSVELVGGSPAYWTCYLSIVDNTTDDPTYVMPVAE